MTLYLHKFFHYLTSFYSAGNVMLGPLSLFSSVLLETSFAAYNILCQVRFFPTIWFKAPSVHLTDLLQIWGAGVQQHLLTLKVTLQNLRVWLGAAIREDAFQMKFKGVWINPQLINYNNSSSVFVTETRRKKRCHPAFVPQSAQLEALCQPWTNLHLFSIQGICCMERIDGFWAEGK